MEIVRRELHCQQRSQEQYRHRISCVGQHLERSMPCSCGTDGIALMQPDDGGQQADLYRELLCSAATITRSFCLHRRRDGCVLTVAIRAIDLLDDPSLHGILWMVRDVI